MCIPDDLLKLDTALPHSLHHRCFLDSCFLSKARSTCGNISKVPYVLNRVLQVQSALIIIQYTLAYYTAIDLKWKHGGRRCFI
jgi:hypothetical protein